MLDDLKYQLGPGSGDSGSGHGNDDDITTHGDRSPNPSEEHYTDPKIGEGSDKPDPL